MARQHGMAIRHCSSCVCSEDRASTEGPVSRILPCTLHVWATEVYGSTSKRSGVQRKRIC